MSDVWFPRTATTKKTQNCRSLHTPDRREAIMASLLETCKLENSSVESHAQRLPPCLLSEAISGGVPCTDVAFSRPCLAKCKLDYPTELVRLQETPSASDPCVINYLNTDFVLYISDDSLGDLDASSDMQTNGPTAKS